MSTSGSPYLPTPVHFGFTVHFGFAVTTAIAALHCTAWYYARTHWKRQLV